MKIQLDTTNKIIKVEENVKVIELISMLKKLLPKEWEEFILETHTTINNWNYPIVIEKNPYYEPYKQPWYCSETTQTTQASSEVETCFNTHELKAGIFNIEA